jgi:Dolichyl-phosphate-mannose-protein mannosyltransferase
MLIPTPSLVELAWWLGLPLALFVALAILVRRRGLTVPGWLESALSSGWAPPVAGVISAFILLFVWGSLHEPQPIHDEQAYVLQAEIFARGRWTGEPPPIPEFFEQTHVFVEPRLASKYPPGTSLLLVPGVWLQLPGLMPVLFTAATGGLLFVIVRRLLDPTLALATWALWSTSTTSLYWRSTYFSQNPDAALWLFSLWALLRWKDEGRRSWLIVVACVFGWMYLTRPLTAVALAVPVGVVVFMTSWRRKLLAHVAVAVACATPLLLLNPLWHERTLGNWRLNPYSEYSRQYMPFDKPGFGLDLTPPIKPMTPPHEWIAKEFVPYHEQHQLAALPAIVTARIIVLMLALGEKWRIGLVVLFVVGATRSKGAMRFGVVSAACLFVAYLLYAHPAWWTVYYTEAYPVFFVIAAYELMRFARGVLKLDEQGGRVVLLVGLTLIAPWLASDVLRARAQSGARGEFQRQAARTLSTIPEERAIVFVEYPPDHLHFQSLVGNTPDYRTARMWVVYDRGEDNDRLLRITDRAAYRLKTADWTLERIR